MFGQLGHPEVGLGLVLVMEVSKATLIADGIVALMTADGIAVVFADLYMERHLPRSLQL
jgi:uncharacterized membrane protein